MKTNLLKFDVMVNGRYYHTMTYPHCSAFKLNLDKVYDYVVKRLPTLKGKKVELAFYNQVG